MNKTAIIEFILDLIALKLWNTSKSMRKRLKWMLKNKNIKLLEFNPKALILNGWVELIGADNYVLTLEEFKKGVSNYRIKNFDQFNTIMSLNGEVRCYTIDFQPEKPISISEINFLIIDRLRGDSEFQNCTFNKVKSLKIMNSSSSDIQSFLDKFKNIQSLQIDNCTLEKLFLNFPLLINIHFQYVKFTKPVILPDQINFLKTEFCANLHFVKAKNVNRLFMIGSRDAEAKIFSWIGTLQTLRTIHNYYELMNFLEFLPSSVRILDCNLEKPITNTEEAKIKEKLPYLIEISYSILIETAKNLNLRKVKPILGRSTEISDYRPRKIEVTSSNSAKLEEFPELFEKVEHVYVDCANFKLDCLPKNIKLLEIEEINEESTLIRRLREE